MIIKGEASPEICLASHGYHIVKESCVHTGICIVATFRYFKSGERYMASLLKELLEKTGK